MTETTCKDCEMRCVGCHGRNEDGTWRCRKWGDLQERKAEERRQTSKERITAAVGRDYAHENIRRFERKKKQGHLGR